MQSFEKTANFYSLVFRIKGIHLIVRWSVLVHTAGTIFFPYTYNLQFCTKLIA